MKPFIPADAVEEAIHAGDLDATIAALRLLTPEQRARRGTRLRALWTMASESRWADTPAREAWGGKASDEQQRALANAVALCGSAADLALVHIETADLVALAAEFQPRSLPGLAQAHLDVSPARAWAANELVRAGLCERPGSAAYFHGLTNLSRGFGRGHGWKEELERDPGLVPALLRVLDHEGDREFSLAGFEKYNHDPARSWSALLALLVERGDTTPAALLDKVLGALERDWPQFRSSWFSRQHAEMAPDAQAMRPHLRRYLGLCSSRIAPTVALALKALSTLDADAPIDADALLGALRPVMSAEAKGSVEAALGLLDRVVARSPALGPRASALAALALSHEAPALQKTVLARIARWGIDADVAAALHAHAPQVAASNRGPLEALLGTAIERTTLPAPAADPVPRAGPLDAHRAVAPPADIPSLVECIAHVFENPADVDGFEQALAALVAWTPLDADARAAFAPVRKRAARIEHLLGRQLARLMARALDEVPPPPPPPVLSTEAEAAVQHALHERIEEATAASGRRIALLSTPTHRGGFIAPDALVERARAAAGQPALPLDEALALARLPARADCAPALLARAQAAAATLAPSPFARALRKALAEADPPAPPASWSVEIRERNGYEFLRLLADEVSAKRFEALPEPAIVYLAALTPARLHGILMFGAVRLGENMDWSEARWADHAYLRLLLEPTCPCTPAAALVLALGLACKEPGQGAIAVDVLVAMHRDGRLDLALLADTARRLCATPLVKLSRWRTRLEAALRAEPGLVVAAATLACAALAGHLDAPRRDAAALLELLVELRAAGTTVPAAGELAPMNIRGRGRSLLSALLQ